MPISMTVSNQAPKEGEAVEFTVTSPNITDAKFLGFNSKGQVILSYDLSGDISTGVRMLIVPSRYDKITKWFAYSPSLGEQAPILTITVQAGVAPPTEYCVTCPECGKKICASTLDYASEALERHKATEHAVWTVRISASVGGSTDPAPGSYTYPDGHALYINALPDPDYVWVRWEINGVVNVTGPGISLSVNKDLTCHAVFEKEAAPPPPPPPVEKATLKVTVVNIADRRLISGAKVLLNGLLQYTDPKGVAFFADLEPKAYSLRVEAAGYDTQESTVTLSSGQAGEETINVTAGVPTDALSALVGFLRGLWDTFLGALGGFASGISAKIEDQAKKQLADAQAALSGESPDQETEEKAQAVAENVRRRQEELIRRMYTKSPALELAPSTAQAVLTLLLGTQVTIEAVATVADNIQPLRSTRVADIAQRINDSLGMRSVIGSIAMMPTETGLIPQLRYWFNSQFTPLIPNIQDLITMLVREVITPSQYVELAAMHGESKLWADRRWEAHWRLPAPEMIKDAHHRGIISAVERDAYMVLHDYRPSSRPGISLSDLRIIAGLQKELIPRVDLRRGWELNLIDDAELLRRYIWLGFEDDAPLMADIQKEVALESERLAVVRAAGRCFRDRKITEARFREELKEQRILGLRADLWVKRYLWERAAKPTKAEESAEELGPIAPVEETA